MLPNNGNPSFHIPLIFSNPVPERFTIKYCDFNFRKYGIVPLGAGGEPWQTASGTRPTGYIPTSANLPSGALGFPGKPVWINTVGLQLVSNTEVLSSYQNAVSDGLISPSRLASWINAQTNAGVGVGGKPWGNEMETLIDSQYIPPSRLSSAVNGKTGYYLGKCVKGVGGVGVVLEVVNITSSEDKPLAVAEAAGSAAGGWGGASAGAAVGTFIAGPIGSVIGGVVGGFGGSYFGAEVSGGILEAAR